MRMVCLLSLCLLVTGCTGSSSSGDAVVDAMVDTGAPVEDASAGTGDGANSGDRGLTEAAEEYRQEPTWWSPEATQVVADLRFIQVDGTPFFALGLHVSAGLTYDGIAGPGECDKSTGKGYLDINVEKTHEAAAAGANFAFLWGYGNDMTQELLDVTPRFKGRYHGEYGQVLPEEDDVIPILLNDHGEVDLDGFDPDKVVEMEEEFADFMARTGKYSPDNMPNLPPVEQVGHMAWHPTFRMIGTGDGDGEMLTSEQATALAQTMNMMIGDTYTYVENRFDWNDPAGAIMAAGTGQKGDIGEGYDDWLAADDPDHRSMFDSGFELAHSLRSKSKPDAVVWMWLQGYSFGRSIQHSECRGKSDDSWATGGFPPLTYLVKEATGMIAAGATGFIFFGYPETLPEEAEIIHTFLSALGHEEVYGPILLSPRLDLGIDTLFMGEEGYDGKGRVHAVVKWHEASRTAAIVASNPGARATAVTFPFPWSLESAELLDWEAASFAPDDALQIVDRSLSFSMPPDSGLIVRVVPRMHP
jgi:hypothetical protein